MFRMPIILKRPAPVLLFTVLWAFFFTAELSAQSHVPAPLPLVDNGGYVVTRNSTPIFHYHGDHSYIPASTLKIATALAALEQLGESSRFKTEFYLRAPDELLIKGYGDPFLVSERIGQIAQVLKRQGLRSVGTIILDDTFFAVRGAPDGAENSANPYDAVNSALAVNFNSLPLLKYDTGALASPEPQTPLLPIAIAIGGHLESGRHRVNVSSFAHKDPSITHHRYVAELFGAVLRSAGIAVAPDFTTGTLRPSDRLVHTYYSELSVAEMIRECLKYSNNFIANQLFLAIGADRSGPPATWSKSRQAITELLEENAGISPPEFTIVEGSGLSRRNRVTPMAMIKLLDAFKPHAHLLGRTGETLLKSGTLSGVYGYAGYFKAGGRLDPFVLLLNQQRNTRDELLTRLTHIHHQAGTP